MNDASSQSQGSSFDGLPDTFNDPQKSRILASVSYMDKLLIDVDEILTSSSSESFPKYKNPLTPVQVRVARDYIKRLRQQIKQVLRGLEISLPEAKFDSTHSIRVTLQFIEAAIEEIAPERLVSYGKVPGSRVNLLAGGLQEMKGIVRQLDSYLIQRSDKNLSDRLARLSATGKLSELFATLAAIIDRHGFVEFRAPLLRLLEKMENLAYEIAFFGRVSAGKSSLLNRIIGTDLLPTGVTPVTAVPTRIRNRSEPALHVWTADGRTDEYDIQRLADFVTEARNPGNHKRVTRLVAEVPLAILPPEVVLVDTPGLGSLALEGATETLAYLPHCDLGVVLVDASSNLHSDDVATLDALRAASVPAVLVLSKSDLVAANDLEQLVEYTRKQVAQQLGTAIDVAPLSSHPEMAQLLEQWVSAQIAPRIANARQLAEESNQRKTATLAERILHALEMFEKTATGHKVTAGHDAWRAPETQLREVASLIEGTRDRCFQITGQIREAADGAITALTENAIARWQANESTLPLENGWISKATNQVAQHEAEELACLVQTTARELSAALDAAAQSTSTGERSERFSLDAFVKELPAPDFSGCAIELSKSRLLSVSTGLAKSSVKHQIESKCGARLAEFFNSYGRALELWFVNVLSGIEKEFNATADIYRAQLQRLSAPMGTTHPAKDEVLTDISALKDKLGIREGIEEAASPVSL